MNKEVSYTYHMETTITFLPSFYISISTFCGLKQLKEIRNGEVKYFNLKQKHTKRITSMAIQITSCVPVL